MSLIESFFSDINKEHVYDLIKDIVMNNFEINIEGWSIGEPSDNATAGIWELAAPVGTYNDDGFQVQPGSPDLRCKSYPPPRLQAPAKWLDKHQSCPQYGYLAVTDLHQKL